MAKFREGQYVYIVENNRWVRKATVISYSSGFYTLAILEGGLTRLKEYRIFETEEEALKLLPPQDPPKPATPSMYRRTHHFYT